MDAPSEHENEEQAHRHSRQNPTIASRDGFCGARSDNRPGNVVAKPQHSTMRSGRRGERRQPDQLDANRIEKPRNTNHHDRCKVRQQGESKQSRILYGNSHIFCKAESGDQHSAVIGDNPYHKQQRAPHPLSMKPRDHLRPIPKTRHARKEEIPGAVEEIEQAGDEQEVLSSDRCLANPRKSKLQDRASSEFDPRAPGLHPTGIKRT